MVGGWAEMLSCWLLPFAPQVHLAAKRGERWKAQALKELTMQTRECTQSIKGDRSLLEASSIFSLFSSSTQLLIPNVQLLHSLSEPVSLPHHVLLCIPLHNCTVCSLLCT